MAKPESIPEIIEVRDPNETCSQFVFGPDCYYIDEAYRILVRGGNYRVVSGYAPLLEGDLVFYGNAFGPDVYHVARVDGDGLVVSKFTGNPNVYRHQLWGDPIPLDPKYGSAFLYRT